MWKESSRICSFFSGLVGVFVELRKATITFVMLVCILVRPFARNCSDLAKRIFLKVYIGRCYTENHQRDSGSGKILYISTFTIRANLDVHEIKAIPVQAWTDPEGSRRSRLPDFQTICISRWQVCQPYARVAFTA